MPSEQTRNQRGERILLYHDYAPIAWMGWFGATVLATLVGPFVGYVPGTEYGIIPSIMLVVTFFWMLAGASVGWLPRP